MEKTLNIVSMVRCVMCHLKDCCSQKNLQQLILNIKLSYVLDIGVLNQMLILPLLKVYNYVYLSFSFQTSPFLYIYIYGYSGVNSASKPSLLWQLFKEFQRCSVIVNVVLV